MSLSPSASLFSLPSAACSGSRVTARPLFTPGSPSKSSLFGNSFTSVNDLPGTVAAIALSLDDQVEQASSAPGGYTFRLHTTNSATLSEIGAQPWSYVILQEQSELPALPYRQMARETLPYAR